MSRRDQIKDLYASTADNEKLAMANFAAPMVERPQERAPPGPVRSMGLALDRMEDEKRQLQEALATGSSVVELDPGLVDASIVRDRLSEPDDAGFEAFKQSIADRGQEGPILVRPHPRTDGRYQVAYGHRRLRAVHALGRKVRAVVRAMSDTDLVIAQGIENSQRKDLSYIERALFAARLEDRGFERSVIIDALATDKGELSKLISVARSIPEMMIEAIGPAPKAGRRRWQALADALRDIQARRAADRASQDPQLDEGRYGYQVSEDTFRCEFKRSQPSNSHQLEERLRPCRRDYYEVKQGDKFRFRPAYRARIRRFRRVSTR